MRSMFFALLAGVAPSALLAAPVERPATVTAVTLFPQGAQVTRTVDLDGQAGEVLVPNLPQDTDSTALRVTATGDVALGAVTLIDGRAPASAPVDSPALVAARAKVAALETALTAKTDAIAAIRAKGAAALARAGFLTGLSTQNTPVADVAQLAQIVGDGVLAAQKDAIAAEAEARAADAALKPDRDALAQAQQAVVALEHPDKGRDALLIDASGKGQLTITTFVGDAGWAPAYDLRLDSAAGKLGLDRFATIHQATGEDWQGVELILSTARPSDQVDPSELSPELVSAGPPVVARPMPMAVESLYQGADAKRMAAAPAPRQEVADLQMTGETVTYRYPSKVDIRDGVEDLRLTLDTLSRPVTVVAEAVPRLDQSAYRLAEGVNAGAEPLLPGPAALFVDGAMIGTGQVPAIAAGDRFGFGFGPVEGLKLTRIVPQASAGDRGFISKSNQRVEVAQIAVQNLTGRDWPVRLIDRVPYSEQDDLKVTWKADPAPGKTDMDGQRGLLQWEFTVAAGKTQEVQLETTLNWPSGQVLQ